MKATLAAVLAAALLGGCALGRNFERPSPDTLRLGQSRYAELVEKLGPPEKERLQQRGGTTVREVEYAYSSQYDGEPPLIQGGIPGRTLWLYFHDDVLVGHLFNSSWRADHTDFDAAKARLIVQGTTSRDEIVALLGRPAGNYIHPMEVEPGGELLRYFFATVWFPRWGNRGAQRVQKWVQVEVDARGIVCRMDVYDEDSRLDPANNKPNPWVSGAGR